MATIGIDASRAVSAAPTGTEAYAYHLIRALLPLLEPHHDVRLYFREPPDASLNSGGFAEALNDADVRVMPFPRLWTHARLSVEMGLHPPNLLFVPAHVLPLVRPRRTLVTVHDLGYRRFPEAHPTWQRRYLELSTRWNVRVATHVLADSQATRDAIVEAYGTDPEKITVVHPGCTRTLAPARDHERLRAVRERYALTEDYVLFIGRVQPRKNLERLIDAFAHIAPDYPALSLVLAGPTGWLSDPIEARARDLDLGSRVRFTGYIAEEDKAPLISGARAFAFPSLYEGFGFPVLEAQACGTPLLTSTTSSLPEVAGEGALLVDPHDVEAIAAGLRRLLDNADLRWQLVAHGYENLTRFSWADAARQVRDVMLKLLT
jgi:glycosyltransferase involved in cell wall biosynthesis